MGRSTPRQALVRAARNGGPVQRVEIPRVSCPRCGQEGIYALPSGEPRGHLRPADRERDPGSWSPLVPVRVPCVA
jgi:hypothetical protein